MNQMTKDEALKLALEFVEANHSGGPDAFELITAIKQALAAPVQEPSIPAGWERRTVVGFDALVEALDYAERKGFMPDYIADAWEGFNYLAAEKHTPPAAQRQWTGLTDEEIKHMPELFVISPHHVEMVVQAIEAKLKEKNT